MYMPIPSITSNPYENILLKFGHLLRLNITNRKIKDHNIERYLKTKWPPIFVKVTARGYLPLF